MNHDDDVVIDIEAILEGTEPHVTKECCIYKVPFHIRRLREDAYTPKVVSIGPFNHNRHVHLQNMEKHKLMYCKAFLKRTKTSSDSWMSYIEEPKFRRCYSETLEFRKKELVKIIFVDSGFILELFWRSCSEWSPEDTFLSTPWLSNNMRKNLFFVLEDLYNMSFTGSSNIPPFARLTFCYFGYYNGCGLSFDNISINHFTDPIRTFNLQHPRERRPPRTAGLVEHLPSAAELLDAGVRLKVSTTSNCLLDLSFSGQDLEIPQLLVSDSTEFMFCNMMALELCHYPYEAYITDYVSILDFLINTSKDVDILVRKKVLVNWLGDTDSVANMFNGLLKNNIHSRFNSHYSEICQDLNALCRNPWHNLKSTLRRDYCKTPWQTAATIAGIVLLILSIIQTVCSVLQVIQQ